MIPSLFSPGAEGSDEITKSSDWRQLMGKAAIILLGLAIAFPILPHFPASLAAVDMITYCIGRSNGTWRIFPAWDIGEVGWMELLFSGHGLPT